MGVEGECVDGQSLEFPPFLTNHRILPLAV